MSTTDKPALTNGSKVNELTNEIEQTRAGMNQTISALETRLNPSDLMDKAKVELDHVEARVKAAMKDGLDEAKGALEHELQVAKDAFHQEIIEAKGSVKEVLDEKLEAARVAVHEEILVAKSAVKEQLHETKDMVTQGLSDARDTLKKDLQQGIANTKQAVRDATIGRVEDIATKAGDVMITTRDTIVDTIRQNPVPAALAGIGLAWLLMNRSNTNRQRNATGGTGYLNSNRHQAAGGGWDGAQQAIGNAASGAAHQVRDAVSGAGSAIAGVAHDASMAARSGVTQGAAAVSHLVDATTRMAHDASGATGQFAHNAADMAGTMVHQAQQMTGNLATGAVEQARRVEKGLEATLESNPLALGAVAMAIGAAVGYSLPRTTKENELMGDMRGRMLEGATHLAHDATQSLIHAATEAGSNVKESLSASK